MGKETCRWNEPFWLLWLLIFYIKLPMIVSFVPQPITTTTTSRQTVSFFDTTNSLDSSRFNPFFTASNSRASSVSHLYAFQKTTTSTGNDDNNHNKKRYNRPKSNTRNFPKRQRRGNRNAIKRNKQIIALGKQRKWRDILILYKNEGSEFNNVNYAATMSQLQRTRSTDKRDPLFLQFVDGLANEIEDKGLDWIGIREISTIVHAIGKLGLRQKSSRKIFEFVSKVETALAIVSSRDAQAVSNIGWSMATVGDVENFSRFHSLIERQPAWFVENGTPQAVANLAWACGTLGVSSPNLFSEIDHHTSWLVENGSAQAVANMAWACGKLGVPSPNLFSEIDRHVSWFFEHGNPQDIANMAWACGKLGVPSPNLFADIERRSSWLVENGTTQAVANTAWAFATLVVTQHQNFFESFMATINDFLLQSIPQDIFNMCYALAVLDLEKQYEAEFLKLWSHALSFDPTMLSNEEKFQLFQVYAFAKASWVDLEPPKLSTKTSGLSFASSRSQQEASCLLLELGFYHETEVCPFPDGKSSLPEGMLTIDMACRERMIAIEFDGPSHFLQDVRRSSEEDVCLVENGATKAKRRFLERLGWTVINISYMDWINAKSKERKREFLQTTLGLNN